MPLLKKLLSGYSAPAGRYDELLAAPNQPRLHWEAFIRAMAARDVPEIGETLSMMEREIRDNGITYNVYADPQGNDRLWEVDPLPLLLPAAQWQAIEAGVAQRAELLNRVLADIYGKQDLLRSGAVPPAVIFGHGGFLHAVQGVRPSAGVHLFHYAADLARAPDGSWWLVADRTQAPSGAAHSHMEPATATGPEAASSRACRANSTARRLMSATASAKPAGSSTWRPDEKVLAMMTSAPAAM